MHHIIYISSASVPVDEAELRRFLTHYRRNNARDGVTGILLYSEREARFMQVIEGEKTLVQSLFATIQQDSRHHGIVKLADGSIPQRHFSTWLMGFRVVSAAAFAELAGYVAPHGAAFQQAMNSTPDAFMQELLKSFASDEISC